MSDSPPVDEPLPPPDGLTGEMLVHNPASGVTGGIWRVKRGGRDLVCKLLTPPTYDGPRGVPVPAWWTASTDLRHWNYWQRELLAYQDRLVDAWGEPSLDMAELVEVVTRPDGSVELWLEAVDGVHGPDWTLAQIASFARALGRGQARLAGERPRLDRPWLSRGFMADYTDSKPASDAVLHDDRRWEHPLVADTLGPLRSRLVALREERARFFALLDGLPRTLCHLDVWPNNLIARTDGRTVLLDWAFVGSGALGEDPANLVPDSVFDHLIPSSRLDELADTVTTAYLDGVADSGWRDDDRLALLGMRASAVKYHWLAALMLERADDEVQFAYGGRGTVDPHLRYAERAAGLSLLCDWADEARTLARRLDLW